jgi:multiple sugar transport system permease protein
MHASVSTTEAPAGRRRVARFSVAPWMFLAPALIISALVLFAPIIYTVFLSFRGTRVGEGLLGKREETFVGFENFTAVLQNSELWSGMGRMLIYALIMAPIMLALAVTFALLLDSGMARLGKFSRLAIFLPYAVPGVIASIMWGFLYLPGVTPLKEPLGALGLSVPNPLGSDLVYWSLANIGIWGGVGFNMVIIYTALRTIPGEIYDSARLDGANGLQIALQIKLRMVTPALVLTALFAVIGALQVYTEPQTLRPLTTAISTTFMPMMTVYSQAFIENDLFGAAATSLVVTAITLAASVLVLLLSRSRLMGDRS